jgi:transcriptional regulator with XRE-family HTH domain
MTSTEFHAARLKLGLNQQELGALLGMPRAHISRLETSRTPTNQQAATMALLEYIHEHGLLLGLLEKQK